MRHFLLIGCLLCAGCDQHPVTQVEPDGVTRYVVGPALAVCGQIAEQMGLTVAQVRSKIRGRLRNSATP